MPETRFRQVFNQAGQLVAQEPYAVSDQELQVEADSQEIRENLLNLGRQALANWGTLTNAQKDRILKGLLRYVLWREGV